MQITDLSILCKWETLKNRQCIKYLFAPLYMYIQSWPKISAPLVNMIKGGCENVSELLILLIFYLKIAQNSNLSLDNTNLI